MGSSVKATLLGMKLLTYPLFTRVGWSKAQAVVVAITLKTPILT